MMNESYVERFFRKFGSFEPSTERIHSDPRRHYEGTYHASGEWAVRIVLDVPIHDFKQIAPLDPCIKMVNHSPTGFAWGYQGSGPAQLAFALLYHVTKDKETSQRFYQRFKTDVIGAMPMEGNWKLSYNDIVEWLGEGAE
jgi:hypothetical protein